MTFTTTGWIMGGLVAFSVGTFHEYTAWAAPGESAGTSSTESQPVCRNIGITVSFASGSYDLDTNAKGALDGVATWLGNDEKRTVKLAGHADISGNAASNVTLSGKRADAVKDYLLQHGIDGSRIMTAAQGETSQALPAEGRTVTFIGCSPAPTAAPTAEATPAPAETPPPAPAEPEPMAAAPEEATPPPPPPVVPAPLPPAQPYTDVYPAEQGRSYLSPVGFGLIVGGGYTDFTNSQLRNTTNAGGSWDARFILGLKSVVGAELAYVGSTQQLTPLGLSSTSYLTSNGAEGVVRLNVPIIRGMTLIEPFGFAGVGWSHYSVSHYNSTVLADYTSVDDIMTVPVGGGLAFATHALMLDVRGSWTQTYYNNILPGVPGALNHWGVGGNVGVAF
ncbi:MAG TPA: OmpA family protein [Polyangia bacterium]|nr:OmpA family protein [Polyangia bacterium]